MLFYELQRKKIAFALEVWETIFEAVDLDNTMAYKIVSKTTRKVWRLKKGEK